MEGSEKGHLLHVRESLPLDPNRTPPTPNILGIRSEGVPERVDLAELTLRAGEPTESSRGERGPAGDWKVLKWALKDV